MTFEMIYFVVVSVLFITVVLLQQKNADLGSLGGGDTSDTMAQTRRGADQFLYRASIFMGILLIGGGLAFMAL